MTRRNDFELLCRGGEIAGPASVQEIEFAQAELGVTFPTEYRDFLTQFGALVVAGIEIFGLPDLEKPHPPLWQSVVAVTKQLRCWGQAGADRAAFIPISEDGTGIYFFLDTAVEPTTRIWAVGPGVETQVSSDFYDFFIDLSEGKIVI